MDLFWIRSKWPIKSHGTGSRFTFVDGRVRSGQKWRLASQVGRDPVGNPVGIRGEKIGKWLLNSWGYDPLWTQCPRKPFGTCSTGARHRHLGEWEETTHSRPEIQDFGRRAAAGFFLLWLVGAFVSDRYRKFGHWQGQYKEARRLKMHKWWWVNRLWLYGTTLCWMLPFIQVSFL